MRKFDTKIQHLKYKVLREVARLAWEGKLMEKVTDIPETLVPGPKATMRCCIYKERAILAKRVGLAMGGNRENKNVIEVISIACDECPMGGYEVTMWTRSEKTREKAIASLKAQLELFAQEGEIVHIFKPVIIVNHGDVARLDNTLNLLL